MAKTASKPLKWHGGKSYLAKWIREHYPPRETYTHSLKAYAGGLATLFEDDPEGISETVNDLNRELSNFWGVLASADEFDEFHRIVSMLPMNESLFESACEPFTSNLNSMIARAAVFFVRYRQSRQGLGKDYATPTRRTRRGMNENVSAWLSAVEGLQEAHERLIRVEIRNMDALEFIRKYDHPKAFFYLDPPYLHETRVTTSDYEFEMGYGDHCDLLNLLKTIKGQFLISGYPSKLYSDWASSNQFKFDSKPIDNKASSKKVKEQKIECLWRNYDKVAR